MASNNLDHSGGMIFTEIVYRYKFGQGPRTCTGPNRASDARRALSPHVPDGRGGEDRTRGLLLPRQALIPLSYTPMISWRMVAKLRSAGPELTGFRFT